MTREQLQEANKLNHAISNLEQQIAVVEDMHHCDRSMVLEVDTIGAITIAWDDELKDGIIDMVLSSLDTRRGVLEDKLRLL